MFEYTQEFLENRKDQDTTGTHNLRILHGPFSPLHIESKLSPEARIVTLSSDTDSTVYIPQTEEIGREEFAVGINEELTKLPPEKQSLVKTAMNQMISNYGNQTYGEYLPGTYTLTPADVLNIHGTVLDGKSVNPVLFISNFLLKEAKNGEIRKEIVLHPDTLFFLSKGSREELQGSLEFLNNMATALGVHLYFENVQLANPKMQKVFGMFIDPFQLHSIVKEYSNLGVAVDIKHMEKHFPQESIENSIQSIVNSGHSTKVLIHSREGLETKYPMVYQLSIRNGIPWVVEE